jgi:hypothetical protein
MANFFDKLKKFNKKIWKKTTKFLKRVVKSKAFKVVLAAAAIYFGGAAMGWWGQGANAAGTGVSTLANSGGTSLLSGGTGNIAALDSAVGGVVEAGTAGLGGAGLGGTGSVIPTTNLVTQAAPTGLLGKAGAYAAENPLASAMALQAVGNMAAPDEKDLMEEQERIRRESWQNMAVPETMGVSVNSSPLKNMSGQEVYDPSGRLSNYYKKYGLLGRSMT